jgi:chromosomal replication initiator protein
MTPYIYAGLSPKNKMNFKLSTIKKRSEVVKSPELTSEINLLANHIIKCAAFYFQVTESDLKGKSRLREITEARHLAIYAIKANCMGSTLIGIGKMFNRHHATILYAIDNVNNLFQTDKKYKSMANEFLNGL